MGVVGIADCLVSKNPQETLITYALGSCIAVITYDPLAKVGGLLHYMLPEAQANDERAKKNPFMFGNTGIPELIQMMVRNGAEQRRIVVRLAGGAQILNDATLFDIGRKNQLSARKMFWKIGVLVKGEAVGGSVPRTVRLDIASGAVGLREGMKEVPFPAGATNSVLREAK